MIGSTRPDGTAVSKAGDRPTVSRRTLLRGAGAAGLVGATASTPATAQAGFNGWLDDVENYDGTVTDMTGQSEVTVEVGAEGNGGPFGFGPAALRVSPETSITFEWTSDNHNVLVEEQPGEADWTGEEAIENSGYTYSHTFQTEGVYKYYCQPHLAVGMKGAIVVGPASGTAGGGGGGGDVQAPTGPPEGVTVWELLALGVGSAALLSPFGVYYYQQRREVPGTASARDEHGAIREAAQEDLEEIGHDEYDPWGTLSLIVVYFLILVGLWTFMYFVEFLGNGPTVIG